MPFVLNPSTGEVSIADDPTGLLEQGYELATPEQAQDYARQVDFGTPGQTALGLGERVVRGGTLGLVDGFGEGEDIQGRAQATQEQHPVLSFAADVLPDVAVGALTGGLGEAAAGAARLGKAAAGVAGLAAESLGSGAVMAGQEAFAEGRQPWADIGADAENALIWGGLNFGLGAIGLAREGLRDARAAKGAVRATDEGIEDIARAEEAKSFRPQLEGGSEPPLLGAGSDPTGITPGPGAPELPPAGNRLNPLESLNGADELAPAAITTQGEPVGDFVAPVSPPLAGAAEPGNAAVTAEAAAPRHLDDVRLPDADGYLEQAAPEAITPEIAADIERMANGALVGKSLDDLKALPLDEGGAAAKAGEKSSSREKIDAFKQDATFQREGMLSGNNDRERGGLPRFNAYQEDGAEKLYLANGRHRLTAAREMGRDSIQANIVSHDAEGNALWDYVGPVKIGGAADDKASRIADLSKQFSELTGLSAKQAGGVAALGAAGALQGEGDTDEAAGAGLGVIGAMLLGGKLFRGAGRDAAKHAVEDGLERAVRNASRADADDVVARVIKGAADEPDSFGRQRRLYQNRNAIYDVAGRELDEAVAVVSKGADGALDRGLASAAKKVGQNSPAQLDAARAIAEDAARFAGGLRAEARSYAEAAGEGGHRFPVPGAKAFSVELLNQAKALADMGTGREAFEALGKFREVASRFAGQLGAKAERALDPERVRALQAKVLDFSASIRKTLERQDTWGAAGEMAAAHHAVDDRLRPALAALSGRSAAAALKGADPEKRAALLAALKAAGELSTVESRFGDAALGKRLGEASQKAQRTLGLADEVADATDRMQAINAVTPDLLNQFITGDVMGKFRRLAGATDASLDRSVDEWISSSRAPGRKALPTFVSHEDDALMATAKRRGISRGMALFLGDDNSSTSAFLKKRDALMDEEKFFHELGQDFRSLQQQAPEAFMVMSAQASIARQFLLDKMPANVSVSMANPLGYPPSKDAIEDWSVYWNAIKYPREASRKLAAMRATEAETIRTVYPRYFEKLQQKALMRLGAAQAMGQRIDDTVAFRLGLLFDIDGPASPAFSQDAAKGVRAFNKQAAEASAGKAPSPPPASNQQAGTVQGIAQSGPTMGSGF